MYSVLLKKWFVNWRVIIINHIAWRKTGMGNFWITMVIEYVFPIAAFFIFFPTPARARVISTDFSSLHLIWSSVYYINFNDWSLMELFNSRATMPVSRRKKAIICMLPPDSIRHLSFACRCLYDVSLAIHNANRSPFCCLHSFIDSFFVRTGNISRATVTS